MSKIVLVNTPLVATRFRSQSSIGLALVVVAVLRSGFNAFGALDSHVAIGTAFPSVEGYFRSSWLHFSVWHVLGISENWQAVLYGSVITGSIFVVAWLFVALHRGDEDRLPTFVLLVMSPISVILLQHLGIYDSLMILGAIILVGSSSLMWMTAGAILLLGANFELGVVALLSLIVLSFTDDIKLDRGKLAIASAVGLVVSLAALIGWFGNFFGDDSRSSWLQQHLRGSLVNFAVSFPFMILSFYGVAWLLVGGFLYRTSTKKDLVAKVIALVLLPGLAASLTLDGTRVFVSASAPVLFAICLRSNRSISEYLPARFGWRHLLIVSVLIPALMVHFGTVKLPYQILYGRL